MRFSFNPKWRIFTYTDSRKKEITDTLHAYGKMNFHGSTFAMPRGFT